ncbi:protein FAM214A-like, partial [Stegodyphus dumicola]|uniref:protein FAM214A-like n=1 Tax=Stegodyphus dumicola TaxID=202533 RepID=UPI0015B0AF08
SVPDSHEPEGKPGSGDGKSILRKLYIDLCNLIVESRCPGVTDRGYGAGIHCPPLLGSNTHCCDLSKPECQKHQRLVHRLLRALKKNVFEIEVLMLPDCCEEMKLCENIQNKEYILLERWSMDCTYSQTQSAIDVSQLLRAVRSFLYFSQISAWLSSTRGKSPSNIYYWIKLSADVTTVFECEPDLHSFPVCRISEGLYGTIRVQYRARAQYIPIIPCSKHPPLNGYPLRALAEDSELRQTISSDESLKQILKSYDSQPQTALNVNDCMIETSNNDINILISQPTHLKAFPTDASNTTAKRILKHSNSQSKTPNVYNTVPKISQGKRANELLNVASKSKATNKRFQSIYSRNPSQENLSFDKFPPSKHLCREKLKRANESSVCCNRLCYSSTLQSSLSSSLKCHLAGNLGNSETVQSLEINPQQCVLNATKISSSSEEISLSEEKRSVQNEILSPFQENSQNSEVDKDLIHDVCKPNTPCLSSKICGNVNVSPLNIKHVQKSTNFPETVHVLSHCAQKKRRKRKASSISRKVKFQRISDVSERIELHTESAVTSLSHERINSNDFDNLQLNATDATEKIISKQLNSCRTEDQMEYSYSFCLNPNALADNEANVKNEILDLNHEIHTSSSKCEVPNKISNHVLSVRNNKTSLKLSHNLLKLSLKRRESLKCVKTRNISLKNLRSSVSKFTPCKHSNVDYDQSVQLSNSTNILQNIGISEEHKAFDPSCKTDDNSTHLCMETEQSSKLKNAALKYKSKISRECSVSSNCHSCHRNKCSSPKRKSQDFKQKCQMSSIRKLATESLQFGKALRPADTSGQNIKVHKKSLSKRQKLDKVNTLKSTSQTFTAVAAQNKACLSSIRGQPNILLKRHAKLKMLDAQNFQRTQRCAPKQILKDMKNTHVNLPQTSQSTSLSNQVMISSHVESQGNSILTGDVSDMCSRIYHGLPDENRGCLSRHTSKFRKGRKLLGNFEESILKGCLPPVNRVKGFQAEIGASGSFCPDHLTLPADVHFYEFGSPHQGATLYTAHVTLGDIEYYLPKKGAVQVTLFNPSETVVKMFVLNYDLSNMPPLCHTFMRQKIYYMPIGSSEKDPSSQKWLRFIIHIRFASTRTGKIYLHNDFKIVVL